MKSVPGKLLILVALLWAQFVFAQDVQELYDEAKQALLNGNYQTALNMVADANAQIITDPNLDPNGVFKNRLLPKIENVANAMASISNALQALYDSTQAEMVLPDLPPSVEAVNQYTRQAKNIIEQLLSKRDSILSGHELDPEFRDALRNTSAFRQIERLASVGIVEKLSEKFTEIALVLTDSIKSINSQYNTVSANLEKMKKSATASKAERVKLEEQLAELSQDRMNHMNAISEILMDDAIPGDEQRRTILVDQNLDNVFGNAITSEIKRIEEIGEIDSVGYKELLKNYERLTKYNQIFAKNNITGDQSALLVRCDAAIKNVKVVQPGGRNYGLYLLLAVIAVVLVFAIYKTVVSSKKTKPTDSPKS